MSQTNELYDVLDITNGRSVDFSADPYAGSIAPNGKPIWTPQQAADNLNRFDVNWTFGNNGALDDGVLTYGFWSSLEEVQNSYYTETNADGFVLTEDGDYILAGQFAPFNAQQKALAINALQLWDDLIAVTFQPATSAAEADVTFGFVEMSPAAGAHAYYPQEEALNEDYGFVNAGKVAGDVWANYLYQGSFSGANAQIGAYGWFAITHELGHTLGLAHGGDYNASDDNDGDGEPDPITYDGDAYFYQDSQQYTIMSYFDGSVTGQAAVNWNTGQFAFAQTPAVHDILAVQNIYGADYTTRAGDTVYGFNSTADRAVFNFATNTLPIVTIWDGGGNDTLDLSGFNANNIIDINEGAFSSAGNKITAAQKVFWGGIFGLQTDAQFAAFFAANGLGPDGRPVDNIGIAYGAKIENAIGGAGNDTINGNALNNVLSGNAGNDAIFGGDGLDTLNGGDGADMLSGGNDLDTLNGGLGDDTLNGGNGKDTLNGGAGNDVLNGGNGKDMYVFTDAGTDTIVGYEKGEKFDLSALGATWGDVTLSSNQIVIDLAGANDLIIQIGSTTGISQADFIFA